MKSLLLLLACLMLTGSPSSADAPRYKLTVLPILLNGNGEMDRLEVGVCLNGQGQVAGMRTVRAGWCSDQRAAVWQKGHGLRQLDWTRVTYQDSSNHTVVFPAAIFAPGC